MSVIDEAELRAKRIARAREAIDKHNVNNPLKANKAKVDPATVGWIEGAAPSNVHPLKARFASGLLDGSDLASSGAEAARDKLKKASEAVNNARGIFAGVGSFSVTQAAADAYGSRLHSHRAYAKARVDKFMNTKYVSRYQNQTFAERKVDLFKDFTTAVSNFKEANALKSDMKLSRKVERQDHREIMHALRQKKSDAAGHVYDAAVKTGKITPNPDITDRQTQIHLAMADNRGLRDEARALRNQVRGEIKTQKSAFAVEKRKHGKAIKALSKGEGSVARLMKRLFRTSGQTFNALRMSKKDGFARIDYTVARGVSGIALKANMKAREAAAVVGGVKNAGIAAAAESLDVAAHVAGNVAHKVARRPATQMA